jgi:hypothetical protein
MSYCGHIVCRRCKLILGLGKLLWDGDSPLGLESGFGFWRGDLTEEQLAKAVVHFVAQHITHEVVAVGDSVYDASDLQEYDTLTFIDCDTAWTRTHDPVVVGGVKFYRVPCSHERVQSGLANKSVQATGEDARA